MVHGNDITGGDQVSAEAVVGMSGDLHVPGVFFVQTAREAHQNRRSLGGAVGKECPRWLSESFAASDGLGDIGSQ
jgi:hypothetical protein